MRVPRKTAIVLSSESVIMFAYIFRNERFELWGGEIAKSVAVRTCSLPEKATAARAADR